LEQEFNYNAMVSQRGVLNVFHSDAQRGAFVRRGNALRLHGVDAELLDAAALRRFAPFLDFDDARCPLKGGLLQRRGGAVRHDEVARVYWHPSRGTRLRRQFVAGPGARRLRLPIEAHLLQAFVSEAMKPQIAGVVTFGPRRFYISQSDKGSLVFGGDLDGSNFRAQRGNPPAGAMETSRRRPRQAGISLACSRRGLQSISTPGCSARATLR
jgi:methylglutamate dehydrogenase subunit A